MIDDPQDKKSGIQNKVEAIAWDEFMINGYISHGFHYDESLIGYYWADFGMETIAVIWVFVAATGNTMDMPPSFGSGFIDHGYFPVPLNQVDIWENDWTPYCQERADIQITWYADQTINLYLAGSSLFGLSAAESPDDLVYEPFEFKGLRMMKMEILKLLFLICMQ